MIWIAKQSLNTRLPDLAQQPTRCSDDLCVLHAEDTGAEQSYGAKSETNKAKEACQKALKSQQNSSWHVGE